jgi:hypothetical protein
MGFILFAAGAATVIVLIGRALTDNVIAYGAIVAAIFVIVQLIRDKVG